MRAALLLLVLAACARAEPPEAPAPTVALPEDSGGACTIGCALAPPGPLPDDEIAGLLARVAGASYGAPTLPLETLLFHADATRDYIERNGTAPLDPERARFLQTELARTHAIVSMRLIDASGVVRARLGETRVTLGKKEHLVFRDTVRLQSFEANGTVARVGLGHIWTRY